MKNIRLAILVLLGSILSGFLLICAVYSLPAGKAAMHVRESGKLLEKEGVYKFLVEGDVTTKLDNFTDIIMLVTASYDGEENIVDKAVNNYRVFKKDATVLESCSACGEIKEEDQEKTAYARYWHGYLVVLKPLLLFLNLNEIRTLNLFVILVYLSLIPILLYRQKCGKYIIPYLLACCVINPMTVSVSLQFSSIFHITSVAIIVLLLFYNKIGFREKLWLYFMMIGIAVSFFDLLTYPVVSLAFPLIIYVALNEQIDFKIGLRNIIGYSAMWSAGYVGMWSAKWLLSSILMGENYFADAINSLRLRSGSQVGIGESDVTANLLQIYLKVTGQLKGSSIKYLLLLIFVVCIAALIGSRIQWENCAACILFILIAAYPFIWYAGAKNHSYIHAFFTYRGLSVSVFALMACMLPLIDIGAFKWRISMRRNGNS